MTIVTTTRLSISPTTADFGARVSLSAQVSPPSVPAAATPTGTATFMDGAIAIGSVTLSAFEGSGVGSISTTSLAVGSHIITAEYDGDAIFSASTSVPVTVAINAVAPPPTHGHGHGHKK